MDTQGPEHRPEEFSIASSDDERMSSEAPGIHTFGMDDALHIAMQKGYELLESFSPSKSASPEPPLDRGEVTIERSDAHARPIS